jgi:hypothetical protein
MYLFHQQHQHRQIQLDPAALSIQKILMSH